MRLVAALLLVASTAFAYDAVFFSSTQKITKDTPSLDSLFEKASPNAPVVVLVNPDFVLGQFSKAANAYSNKKSSSMIVNAAKVATSSGSRYLAHGIKVPSTAQHVSATSPYKDGAAFYVVEGENWSAMDALAGEVLGLLADKATLVLVSNSDVITSGRVKRVSTSDGAGVGGAGDVTGVLPFSMPALSSEGVITEPKACLFYLEGLTIVVRAKNEYYNIPIRYSESANPTVSGSFDCPDVLSDKGPTQHTFTFTVTTAGDIEKFGSVGPVSLKLTLESDRFGYWGLKQAELLDDFTVQVTEAKLSATAAKGTAAPSNVGWLGMESVFSFGWSCWDTSALWFKSDGDNGVGVALHGVQLQVFAHDSEEMKGGSYFRQNSESCTPTFSVGSWMGIITSLVLVAVFIFGFLMLNSVQTMDRYDDPKQKQILINVRE